MRLALAAFAALSLAACQPKDKVEAAAEANGQDAPGAPQPAMKESAPIRFEAMSKTAESFTGAVSLSQVSQSGPNAPPKMKIAADNGSTYETVLVPGGAEQATAVDWSSIFNTPISFDPQAPASVPSVDLHAVDAEMISPTSVNGGFCGKEKTSFIAMAIPIPMPGRVPGAASGNAGVMMSIAAFKDTQWPPKDASGLCGTYNYTGR